jgi:plastocyanin
MRRMARLTIPLAVIAVLAPVASAHALTKTVFAGPAGTAGGTFGPRAAPEPNEFSLSRVTIHAGDRVRWVIRGFHTVTFPRRGGRDIPFITPDPQGGRYQGVNDPAGRPFWFNGQPELVYNPLGAVRQGGRTYDGSRVTGSGLPPEMGTPPPYVLRFTRTGTFRYECVVHPGMDASVRVLPRGRPIPSPSADARAARARLAAQARLARRLNRFTPPPNTITGGHDQGQLALLKFFPSTLRVPVGTTVTFSVHSKSEIHTLTLGPPPFLTQLAASPVNMVPSPSGGPPKLEVPPLFIFPSDPPPALPPYDGTNHGNGLLSTGALGGNKLVPRSTSQVTFAKAGTYNFICLIHPATMKGTVVVG